MALGDIDRDGDIDAIVATFDSTQANRVWLNTTRGAALQANSQSVNPAKAALAVGNDQSTPALSADRQNFSFESVDNAGWSFPQPMLTTNANITAWLNLPQFQSRRAAHPFQCDRTVDDVMSRLDNRDSLIEIDRVYRREAIFDHINFTTKYDEKSMDDHVGKITFQENMRPSSEVEDRVWSIYSTEV